LKQELRLCRQWQKRCEEILAQPPTTILIYEVRLEPNDDAAALLRKADFLRDQSDRLERESKRLDKKIAELRQEERLHTRLSEFGEELDMLAPANEIRGNRTANADIRYTELGGNDALQNEAGKAGFSPAEIVVALSWPDNVSNLSAQDLSAWLQHLQHTQKRLRAQADSLRQRAADFETLRRTQQD
jgi:DNA-binding transcriptional MerR regulator